MNKQDYFKLIVTIEQDKSIEITCKFSETLFFDCGNQLDIETANYKLKECFKAVKLPKMITIDLTQNNLQVISKCKLLKSFRMVENYDKTWKFSNSENSTFTEWFETSEDYKKVTTNKLKMFVNFANWQYVDLMKQEIFNK